MILDDETIQILKNFSLINPSIVFKPGFVQSTVAPSKTILAKATLTQEIDRKFAIFDLPKFLSVVSLFKEPRIELGENSLMIISDKQQIRYMYAAEETIVAPKGKEPKAEYNISLTITPDTFQAVYKAMTVLKLPQIAVVGENGKLLVTALDTKNPSSDTYRVQIGETDKTFQMVFKGEYLKILPVQYLLSISTVGVSEWKSDRITYWIAVEANSTFEG